MISSAYFSIRFDAPSVCRFEPQNTGTCNCGHHFCIWSQMLRRVIIFTRHVNANSREWSDFKIPASLFVFLLANWTQIYCFFSKVTALCRVLELDSEIAFFCGSAVTPIWSRLNTVYLQRHLHLLELEMIQIRVHFDVPCISVPSTPYGTW